MSNFVFDPVTKEIQIHIAERTLHGLLKDERTQDCVRVLESW